MSAPSVETYQQQISDVDNFTEHCRVCMQKKDYLTSVFDIESGSIAKEMEFCSGISITKEDGLPVSICSQCREKLTISFDFKTTCIKSDQLFRKLLQLKTLNEISIKKEISGDDCVMTEDVKGKMIKLNEDCNDDFTSSLPDDTWSTITNRKTKIKNKTVGKNLKRKKTMTIKAREKRIKEKPTIKIEQLICQRCHKMFEDKELLRVHTKKEHGVDNIWICEVCGKQFTNKSTHYSHVRSHLPPRYKCDACDYSTWQKSDLRKHCRIHTGVKDYVCEYCTLSFITTSNLHEHIRRNHTLRRRIECPRCSRPFYDSQKLRRHVDTHDNIKRFECEICHAQFSRRCQWKTHLLKQHCVYVPKIRPGRRNTNLVGEEKKIYLGIGGQSSCLETDERKCVLNESLQNL